MDVVVTCQMEFVIGVLVDVSGFVGCRDGIGDVKPVGEDRSRRFLVPSGSCNPGSLDSWIPHSRILQSWIPHSQIPAFPYPRILALSLSDVGFMDFVTRHLSVRIPNFLS